MPGAPRRASYTMTLDSSLTTRTSDFDDLYSEKRMSLEERLNEWDSHWESLYTMDDETIYTHLTNNQQVVFEDLPSKCHVSDEDEDDDSCSDDDDGSLDRPHELGLQKDEFERMIQLLRGSDDVKNEKNQVHNVNSNADNANDTSYEEENSIYSSILNGTSPAIEKAKKKKKQQQKKEAKAKRHALMQAAKNRARVREPPTPNFEHEEKKPKPKHRTQLKSLLSPDPEEEEEEDDEDSFDLPTPKVTKNKKQLQARKRAEARKSVRAKQDAQNDKTTTKQDTTNKAKHTKSDKASNARPDTTNKATAKKKCRNRSQSLSEYFAQAGTTPLVPDLISQDASVGEIKVRPMVLGPTPVPAPPDSIQLPPWMSQSKWTIPAAQPQMVHHAQTPLRRTATTPTPAVTPSPQQSRPFRNSFATPTTAATPSTAPDLRHCNIPQQPEERKRWWYSFWQSMRQTKARKKFLHKSKKENAVTNVAAGHASEQTHRTEESHSHSEGHPEELIESSSTIDPRFLPVVLENGCVEC